MLKIFKNIIGLVQMPLKKYIFKQTKCLLFMLLYTIFSLAFPEFTQERDRVQLFKKRLSIKKITTRSK